MQIFCSCCECSVDGAVGCRGECGFSASVRLVFRSKFCMLHIHPVSLHFLIQLLTLKVTMILDMFKTQFTWLRLSSYCSFVTYSLTLLQSCPVNMYV